MMTRTRKYSNTFVAEYSNPLFSNESQPYLPPHADSSDFGLLGEQSSPKWEIPCPWTTVQNLTLLALSSPDKSVTIQTYAQKNKQ